MGGDLAGVTGKLDYLKTSASTPSTSIRSSEAESNHRYDTADYTKIDPYFGTEDDFEKLDKQAGKRGIRVILDGVFNHMSSDSPFFDRYHHYKDVGACESAGVASGARGSRSRPRTATSAGRKRRLRRLVRLRLDPGAHEDAPGGAGLLHPRQKSIAEWLDAGDGKPATVRPAGAST